MADVLDGFESTTFEFDGKERDVLRAGSGPAVIVIAEMPGITPGVLGFARRVVDLGCTAVLPSLFGTPGREISAGYALSSLASACVSREFTTLAIKKTSPVTSWLLALSRYEHDRCGGPGVGVVGMCFTGGFALGMMVDDAVIAPVLSQPSLPIPLGKTRAADLGVSDDDLQRVKDRCAADPSLCLIGLRFSGDPMVRRSRFASLERELGDSFVGVEIDSSPGNPHGHPKAAHSVLTEHLIDEPGQPTHDALTKVLDLFRRKLVVDSPATDAT